MTTAPSGNAPVVLTKEDNKDMIKFKSGSVKSTLALLLKGSGFVASTNTQLPMAVVVRGVPQHDVSETIYYVKSIPGTEFSPKDIAVLANTLHLRVFGAITSEGAFREKVGLIGTPANVKIGKKLLRLANMYKNLRLRVIGAVDDEGLKCTMILVEAGGSVYGITYDSRMALYLIDGTLLEETGEVKRLVRLAVFASVAAAAQGTEFASLPVYDATDKSAMPRIIPTEAPSTSLLDDMGASNPNASLSMDRSDSIDLAGKL